MARITNRPIKPVWTGLAASLVALTPTHSPALGGGNAGRVSFTEPVLYRVGSFPTGIAAGDLNGDGYADILAVNDLSNSISILLNAGDGTFLPQIQFPVGLRPRTAALGDLDGDGDLDAAVVNTLNASMSVMLNDGAGSFTELDHFPVIGGPIDVVLADVDGDGDLDAVIANLGAVAALLLNAGDGSFPETTMLSNGPIPNSVRFGDIDGDGDVDVISADASSSSIVLYLNDGPGAFGDRVQLIDVDGLPTRAIGADLDGDSMMDLVHNSGPGIAVQRQYDALTFAQPQHFGLSNQTIPRRIADIDLDGLLDVVFSSSETHTIGVAWGDPVGTLSGWQNLVSMDPGAGPAEVDGLDVAALLRSWGTDDGQADLHADGVVDGVDLATLLANWGPLDARVPTVAVDEIYVNDLTLADFDNDGDDDIAIVEGGSQLGRVKVVFNETIPSRATVHKASPERK